jgi:AhpD family alkylhydroperoxidase
MTQTTICGPRLSADSGRSQDAVAGVQQIIKSIYAAGVPRRILEFVHMRASQINGCNAYIAAGIHTAAGTRRRALRRGRSLGARLDDRADQLLQPCQYHAEGPARCMGLSDHGRSGLEVYADKGRRDVEKCRRAPLTR